jgi:SAM-dependent methyltransferase
MLKSGIPRVSEYRELDQDPDFQRLLDYSRRFQADVGARDLFSRLYSIKWVEDPFLQWSRRWEYVYVLQRLEDWWQHRPHSADIADAGSGFTFFPFYLQRELPHARISCIDADPTAGRAIDEAARVLGNGPAFSLGDLEKLDQPGESLDAIFSVSVIEHTANPKQVIEEIHRVLKPRGIFVCTFDVSFEPGSPMHLGKVEQLVDRLQNLFDSSNSEDGSITESAECSNLVTTTWISREFPERLPWRYPRLVWLYDALRGRFRTTLYRPMTFYCGTYIKKPGA